MISRWWVVMGTVILVILWLGVQRQKPANVITDDANLDNLTRIEGATLPQPTKHQVVEGKEETTNTVSSTAQGDALSQTSACDSAAPATLLVMDAQSLSQFYGTDAMISVPVDQQKICLKVGQETVLAAAEGEYLLFRGRGFIGDIIQGNPRIKVTLKERWMGSMSPLAPACLDFCDGIVDKLPKKGTSKTVILDLRGADEIARWSPSGTKSIAITPQSSFSDISAKVGVLKETDFIVMSTGPFRPRKNVLKIMQEMKRQGARTVWWYYMGAAGIYDVPLMPPLLDGVAPIVASQLKDLTARSAKFYMIASGDKMPSRTVPGSAIVKTKNPIWRPERYLTEEYLKQRSMASEFDLATLPKDPKGSYVIYGYTAMDWRPYYLLRYLSSQGFKNLYWMRGGMDEYEEAKNLQLNP